MGLLHIQPESGLQEEVVQTTRQQPGKSDLTGWLGDLAMNLALEVKDDLRQLLRYLQQLPRQEDWKLRRKPYKPPERPGRARVKPRTEPPGGALWLKCARRFKKGARSEPTGRRVCSSAGLFIPSRGRTAAPAMG